ncbi:dihydrofolate reductase family protein [Novosphingobium gossypii]|uniref:dihydrofolate reductase family protein n=1 Tax=Novosphingobium gossypii TaxID=1604774 RepID=UPI003D1C277D
MGRLIVDAASSLDGYWADARGRSVLRNAELHGAGLSGMLNSACGAVVMGRRALGLSDDADWIAEAYPPGTPIFVVADSPSEFLPSATVRFVGTYAQAFAEAQAAAGDRAVLVVGEAGAIKAALRSGEAAEIWLRVVSRTLGRGDPLFDDGIPVENYFVSGLDTTADAVHMHLERRHGA